MNPVDIAVNDEVRWATEDAVVTAYRFACDDGHDNGWITPNTDITIEIIKANYVVPGDDTLIVVRLLLEALIGAEY